jgi:predicted ribosomally synthesized peptide with nif11-like leader
VSKYIDFYNKISADVNFAAEYKKIMKEKRVPTGTPFWALSDDVLDALISLASTAGFDFTLDELKARFSKKSGSELSDDELEAVAGGKGKVPDKIIFIDHAWDDPDNPHNPNNPSYTSS